MAPLSSAERKRRYCAKLSEERHEEVKQQDWERKREKKENTVLTEEQKEERQIKERERKRLYREKLKVLKVKLGQSAFKKTGKQKEKLLKNFTKLFQIHQSRK